MKYKKFSNVEQQKLRMLLQYNIPADYIGITHRFFDDNKNKILELYQIADAVERIKYE